MSSSLPSSSSHLSNTSTKKSTFEINVCSFNIRYDSLLDFGNKSWRVRKALVSKFIQGLSLVPKTNDDVMEEGNLSSYETNETKKQQQQPSTTILHSPLYTLVGLQEVLQNQLQDIKNYLSNNNNNNGTDPSIPNNNHNNFGGFTIFSTGRDAKNGGEHCTIMVKSGSTTNSTNNYSSGTFWLSETPEKPSKYWDAACYRIATWVKVPIPIKNDDEKIGETTYHLLYLNTHWDHFSSRACMHSAKLIKNFVKDQVLMKNSEENLIGVVVSGDFNCNVEDRAFQELLQPLEIESERYGKFSLQFNNSYEYCKKHMLPVLGKETTFNNWSLNNHSSKVTRIDHILFAEIPCPTTPHHISLTPTKYECCEGTAELVTEGSHKKEIIVISDHYPILVNFSLSITARESTQ